MVVDRMVGSEKVAAYDPPSIRRNLSSRVQLGHIVMASAALLAIVFNLAVLRGNESTVAIAVASADIRAGTTLTMSHFTVAEVPADELLTGRFVLADVVEDTIGQLTTRSVAAGQPFLDSDLVVVESRGGLRAMSVPIDQTQAVAGHLASGDSVDIVLVVDGVATYIATSIEVMSVPDAESNALGARSGYAPTVAVTATEALRIAAALDTGEVHIVRSTGSAVPDLEQATAIESQESERPPG